MRHASARAKGAVWLAAFASACLAVFPVNAEERSATDSLFTKSQVVEDLYDAHFVSPERGWAVGVFGAVYHTTDGGRHWKMQATPTIQHLYGIAFADEKRGWVVGRGGEILYTADGGVHWVQQKSGTTKHLFNVAVNGPNSVWAVGDWGVVVHSTDGGQTWHDRSLDRDLIVYSIDFADEKHGWMVGELGGVLYTRDGGENWSVQAAGTEKTFFGVKAVSAEKAWVVGIDGLLVRTGDAGATWQVQHGEAESHQLEETGFVDLFKNPGLYDVEIVDGRGYVIGDIGTVLLSEDGGETWIESPLPAEWRLKWIRGLSILPAGKGMLVGAAGLTFSVDGRKMQFSQENPS